MGIALSASHLTCRYGRTEAVTDLSFDVEPGTVFALLGPNGAGKTTTIRTVMNILKPTSGRATVLGVDSRALGARQLAMIGYVSENQAIPQWMTVEELLAYCRPFYPTWDDALCTRLVGDFDLPLHTKIGRLSRGMRIKAALVSSLAYRPQLLVLDEPFSGLDPVVRDDLVHGVLELAGQQQWTVFLSSHDLDEVERLVDTIGFLDAGRLAICEPFDALNARLKRVEATVANAGAEQPTATPDGWLDVQRAGRVVKFVDTRYVQGETERRAAETFRAERIEVFPMTLREMFVALVRARRQVERNAERKVTS